MKATQIIDFLQDKVNKYGDLEVTVNTDEFGAVSTAMEISFLQLNTIMEEPNYEPKHKIDLVILNDFSMN